MQTGNQHGGREYDDFQNLLYMTSHENSLLHSVWVGESSKIIYIALNDQIFIRVFSFSITIFERLL